jgi:acyl-coenzyme A thioesterase PaaI-like protein
MQQIGVRQGRQARHIALRQLLAKDPLLTDEDLARRLGVSVATVRLDRVHLGIPEVRQREEDLARRVVDNVRAMEGGEVVGELTELVLGERAVSVLETTPDMAFSRHGVVRSHHIFAQADSVALAVIDGDVVLTGLANAKFKRPVLVGERLVAEGRVIRRRQTRFVVLVETTSGRDVVFRGKFLVVALPHWDKGGHHAHRA